MTLPSYGYQWSRSGTAIPGATGPSYTVQSADIGATLTCTVIATDAGGSQAATSTATDGVSAAAALLFGFHDGYSAATTSADASTFFGVSHLPLQLLYLDASQSWDNGMFSSWYINLCAGATKVIMSIPMLVGPPTGPARSNSGTGQTTSPQNPSNVSTPTTMTLAQVAAGTWNDQFVQVFRAIAAVRPDCILRIGWEMYGDANFYPWSGPANGTAFKNAYITLVTLARTVSSEFRFDWSGGLVYNGFDPMTTCYPGDDYVDYVSLDVYDYARFGPGGAAGWATTVSTFSEGFNFALAHRKKWSVTELGPWATTDYGHGDDPGWFSAAITWFKANASSIGYVCFYNDQIDVVNNLHNLPETAAVMTSQYAPVYQQDVADGL